MKVFYFLFLLILVAIPGTIIEAGWHLTGILLGIFMIAFLFEQIWPS
jgi:hypothetical protein